MINDESVQIIIEKTPYTVNKYYSGVYIQNDEEFEFTLVTSENTDTSHGESIIEIEFIDGEPMNVESAINKIKDQF
jgi:hypothetical protein